MELTRFELKNQALQERIAVALERIADALEKLPVKQDDETLAALLRKLDL